MNRCTPVLTYPPVHPPSWRLPVAARDVPSQVRCPPLLLKFSLSCSTVRSAAPLKARAMPSGTWKQRGAPQPWSDGWSLRKGAESKVCVNPAWRPRHTPVLCFLDTSSTRRETAQSQAGRFDCLIAHSRRAPGKSTASSG